jgi:(p)ppGpp synthase/HD superfamily hydrolase
MPAPDEEIIEKRASLTEWIIAFYAGRTIKLSGQPYVHHLLAVAEMAGPFTPFGYEIGLCHDLLEDSEITPASLIQALRSFGYDKLDALNITDTVIELTDVYTARAFPDLDKKERKKREEDRLARISGNAQTVKYCDLVYNAQWVRDYQPRKLKKYLNRKRKLVAEMIKGNQELRKLAVAVLNQAGL